MRFFHKTTVAMPRAKRLAFEALERRDLLTAMRIVSWNTLNAPNTPTDSDYTTILEAIGNETVLGNTKRLDIIALQETDPAGAGENSIGNVAAILDSLYMGAGADYETAISTIDGGGDHTGFVYDTSVVSLFATHQVALSDHNVLRGQFRPVGTNGESDFFIYTVHLTSSGGPAGRAGDAAILRDDADSLPEGSSILVMGDFNMEGSSEAAWTQLVDISGAGQLQDVANAPGEWSEELEFITLHTQDPGGAMDDRFDIQFASGELFDGLGLEYIDGSYRVFGNNGSHDLNDTIDTGSGASPAVLSALAAASDHLPVVVDYELIVSTPGVRIRQTGSGTNAVEGGIYDVYTVVLDTIPEADVTVTVTPDAEVSIGPSGGAGAGVPVNFVFTPENALTPQTVIVYAADDLDGEGTHTGGISHSSDSTDLDYDGLTIDEVDVAILDDDAPTIVINELDSDTPSVDMLEFVELYDGGIGNTSLNGMTLVFFNGSNDLAYRAMSLSGFSTDANGFFVAGNAGIGVADLGFPNNTLQNGADAVALYSGSFLVGGSVTTANLLDAVVYDNANADDPGLLVLLQPGQPQIDEDQHGTNGTIEAIARVPDHGTPRVTATYVAQAPTPDAPNAPPPPGGYLILQSAGRIDVDEDGLIDTYQLSLADFPTSDVTVTIDPDDQVDLGNGAGVPLVLTFTPADAIIPQTITVQAIDDALFEGDHFSVITHSTVSADSRYDDLNIGDVVANIVDNESPVPIEIVITEIMYDPDTAEGGPGLPEWIEVANTGEGPVDLMGWLFDDEDGTNWGAVTSSRVLQPGQVAVIFDSGYTNESDFRTQWAVPDNAEVIGVVWGSLSGDPTGPGDEVLELYDGATLRDVVNFDDNSPWPVVSPDGPSIYLTNLALDNSVGGNWALSVNGVNRAHAALGGSYSAGDIGSPGYLPISADFNFDGQVSGLDFLAWQLGFDANPPEALKVDGDADSDLDVDAGDLALWESDYGFQVGPILAPLVSEPEPLALQLAEEPALAPLVVSTTVTSGGLSANVLLALPAFSPSEQPALVADETPLAAVAVDRAFADAASLTAPNRGLVEAVTPADNESDADKAADEAFDAWEPLALAL